MVELSDFTSTTDFVLRSVAFQKVAKSFEKLSGGEQVGGKERTSLIEGCKLLLQIASPNSASEVNPDYTVIATELRPEFLGYLREQGIEEIPLDICYALSEGEFRELGKTRSNQIGGLFNCFSDYYSRQIPSQGNI